MTNKEKNLRDFILEWIGKYYGTQEKEDPCYNISLLANHIIKNYDIKRKCCCNCANCKREATRNSDYINNYCKLDNHYMDYQGVFEDCCEKWQEDKNGK